MNKAGWIIGLLVIVAAVGGALYVATSQKAAAPSETDGGGSGNAVVGATGVSSIVTYTDEGFSPTPLTIAVGTTVTWSNESSHRMWVAASPEAGCPNPETLNECSAVGPGGSYSYTFTKVGSVQYVNHERNQDAGSVIVTDASAAGRINPQAVPE